MTSENQRPVWKLIKQPGDAVARWELSPQPQPEEPPVKPYAPRPEDLARQKKARKLLYSGVDYNDVAAQTGMSPHEVYKLDQEGVVPAKKSYYPVSPERRAGWLERVRKANRARAKNKPNPQ